MWIVPPLGCPKLGRLNIAIDSFTHFTMDSIWRFPKSLGEPPVIIHFGIVHERNHPIWGIATFEDTSICPQLPPILPAQDQFLQKLLDSGRPEDLRTAAKLSSQGYRSYVWREGGLFWWRGELEK